MSSDHDHSHRLALPPGYLLEDYRIERLLGKGGFGLTYLAVDEKLDAKVAIKELLPDGIAGRFEGYTVAAQTHALDETFQWARERFLEEARTLARLNHPGIVRVVRLMQANGTAYMVMEFVEGESLSAWMKRNPNAAEPELIRLLLPLLDGLDYVHQKGLLHRDVKPDNIFITPQGRPLLLDFGSARSDLGRTVAATTLVSEGYSPREQYQQKSRQGPYSDLYALGAVMVHAMTGKKPSGAIDRWGDPDSDRPLRETAPRHYSQALIAVVERAFAVAPEHRWQSAAEMKQELQRTTSGGTVPGTSVPITTGSASRTNWNGPDMPPMPVMPREDTVLRPVFGQPGTKDWPKLAALAALVFAVGAAIFGFPMEVWDELERENTWWALALALLLPAVFSRIAWRERPPWAAMVSLLLTGAYAIPLIAFTIACIVDGPQGHVPDEGVYFLTCSGFAGALFFLNLRSYLVLRRDRLPSWWRKVRAAASREIPIRVMTLASLGLSLGMAAWSLYLEVWDGPEEVIWVVSLVLGLPPIFALWAWRRGASWAALVTAVLTLLVALFVGAIAWNGLQHVFRRDSEIPGVLWAVVLHSPLSLLLGGLWIWGFILLRRELHRRMREGDGSRV